MIRIETDDDADYNIDTTTKIKYNGNGKPYEKLYINKNSVDKQSLFYDDRGQIVREEYDIADDGSIELTIEYIRDRDCVLIQKVKDFSNNNFIELESYFYDDNGYLKRIEKDKNEDLIADEYEYYHLNNLGSPLNILRDTDADGEIDERLSYGYDKSGRLNIYEYDKDNDGTSDWITVYYWN